MPGKTAKATQLQVDLYGISAGGYPNGVVGGPQPAQERQAAAWPALWNAVRLQTFDVK